MKKFGILAAIVVAFFATFGLMTLSWDLGAKDPASNLDLARCPAESSDEFFAYRDSIGQLLFDVSEEYSRQNINAEEEAQIYKGLWVRNEVMPHPSCAEPLHKAIANTLDYEARAYAALAKGGLFSYLEYRYWHLRSTDNRYLISFVMQRIQPLPTIPRGKELIA